MSRFKVGDKAIRAVTVGLALALSLIGVPAHHHRQRQVVHHVSALRHHSVSGLPPSDEWAAMVNALSDKWEA